MKLFKLILISFVIFTPMESIESFIKLKINNKIVTNVDLDTEYRYLISLNNELQNTDKETLLKIAKESIIREMIKKDELLKYYEFDSSQAYLDNIIKNFYKKMGLESLDDFKDYLDTYDLELDVIKDKIQIEVLWNKLIGNKYKNQLNINEEILKEQINKVSNNNGDIKEYKLSEIIFQKNNEMSLDDKLNLIQKDIEEKGFKTAANIHSIADSSKFGGDTGWVDEKKLSSLINMTINKLEINEISKPIKVTNGFLILKLEDKRISKIEVNKEQLLEQAIIFEQTKQYNQFSIIYYNKIKLNSIISE
jgi:peptidyl-prolyl cis-trans isomerase SurA|tara:strand:- start:454 stop:1374 length:921 start_codon:yes stop_codon:yes gene_type:complete